METIFDILKESWKHQNRYIFVAERVEDSLEIAYEDKSRAKLLYTYDDRKPIEEGKILVHAACCCVGDIVCLTHCKILPLDKPPIF